MRMFAYKRLTLVDRDPGLFVYACDFAASAIGLLRVWNDKKQAEWTKCWGRWRESDQFYTESSVLEPLHALTALLLMNPFQGSSSIRSTSMSCIRVRRYQWPHTTRKFSRHCYSYICTLCYPSRQVGRRVVRRAKDSGTGGMNLIFLVRFRASRMQLVVNHLAKVCVRVRVRVRSCACVLWIIAYVDWMLHIRLTRRPQPHTWTLTPSQVQRFRLFLIYLILTCHVNPKFWI